MEVYLDNAATTKVDDKVVDSIKKVYLESYGNPSSIHKKGHDALKLIENSREELAKIINSEYHELVFTSCGSESNNLVLNQLSKGDHLITTIIEHPSIYNKAKALERQGVEITFLKSDKEGFINLEELESSIKKNTKLVSIIHSHNEVGTIQDLIKIGEICKKHKVLFHSDCVQSLKKTKIDVKDFNLDFASFSAHKIRGPKGVGALYVKKGLKLNPLIYGGGQENSMRSGTENVPGIVGFGSALRLSYDVKYVSELRDYMIFRLEEEIDKVKLNGSRKSRLCNNVNFSFKGIEGESILMSLDLEGIYVSTGSACSSRSLKASRVLLAMGLDHELAHGSIRFTLSPENTKEEIDYVVIKLKEIIKRLRGMSPLK